MSIYTMFGGQVAKVRYATVDDVRNFEKDEPDETAIQAILDKSWVVATRPDGTRFLTHIAKLRADGGLREILDAVVDKDEEM